MHVEVNMPFKLVYIEAETLVAEKEVGIPQSFTNFSPSKICFCSTIYIMFLWGGMVCKSGAHILTFNRLATQSVVSCIKINGANEPYWESLYCYHR